MELIKFFYLDVKPSFSQRTKLKGAINKLFIKEKIKLAGLTYIFCTDNYLLGINKKFLQHHFYTDIITFDLSATGQDIQGEIYISTERVRENAQKFGTSFKEELHRVVFHGSLHLCGYQDKSKRDKVRMRKMEDLYLRDYFQ